MDDSSIENDANDIREDDWHDHDEWDDLWNEYVTLSKTPCPHCGEPLGNESCASNGMNEPYRHLDCLDTPQIRMMKVERMLHRLSRDELVSALEFGKTLLGTKTWGEGSR